MTLPAPQEVVQALRTIGQGLLDLADAFSAQSAEEEKPDTRPAARRSPKPSQPPAEEPDGDSETSEPEEEEIKLSDLQELTRDLLRAGKRPKLVKILERHDLPNTSSAPEEIWPQLKKELEAALA